MQRPPAVEGQAQNPRSRPWAPNPGGARTLDEAIAFARARGVEIHDDVRFVLWPDYEEGELFASYFGGRTFRSYEWKDFLSRREDVPVKIRPSILESDEAILAVFGHEMFELNALRTLFEERGAPVPGPELARLINDGIPGNLHDNAWDYADELVGALRRERAG